MSGTPHQNGVAERQNCTLIEMVRSKLSYNTVPISLLLNRIKNCNLFIFPCLIIIVRSQLVELYLAYKKEVLGVVSHKELDMEKLLVMNALMYCTKMISMVTNNTNFLENPLPNISWTSQDFYLRPPTAHPFVDDMRNSC